MLMAEYILQQHQMTKQGDETSQTQRMKKAAKRNGGGAGIGLAYFTFDACCCDHRKTSKV